MWGPVVVVQNYCSPKLPWRGPFATLSSPSRIGTRNCDKMFSWAYFVEIVVFRSFANLTPPSSKTHTHIHICRCYSDTKSLAWVLGQLTCPLAALEKLHFMHIMLMSVMHIPWSISSFLASGWGGLGWVLNVPVQQLPSIIDANLQIFANTFQVHS